MDRERWDRIQSLFHDAAERAATEQRVFLESICPDDPGIVAEVLALLDEDARGGSLLDRDVARVAADVVGIAIPAEHDPNHFHPYRLKAPLGEGGMGVVYLAERPDLGSLVAIKILRDGWLSPARRRRFETEQRTLAALNHPGIARLYDAHVLPDGTPWFVMEYVDGLPLTDYCAAHANSVEARLRLFRGVCEAVRYAHEHGIVHRDLKPSNILVKADGTVRLLDFGIATQVDEAPTVHRTTVRLMTPAYAAPEQMRGEPASVHTDVYSLGVILYELLAGSLPHDPSGDTEGDRAAFERVPERLSVAARGAAGVGTRPAETSAASWSELDVLCQTAMHPDPDRRYASTVALVRDVDHFLDSEPLDARPDSVAYRLDRFLRRNRRAVAASVAAIVVVGGLAMVAGLAVGPMLFPEADRSAAIRTVAVLPFINTRGDGGLDYLGAALAEETVSTLTYSRSLTVRPLTATRQYDGADRDVRRIGRELGVASVVSGAFERDGDVLRVVIQAIDIASGGARWQDVFTTTPDNMIALQQQIATEVQGGLASALGASEVTPITATRPSNEEAYDLYLHGAGGRYDPGPFNTAAIGMLERAVALDPSYAPAWLALSRRYYIEARYASGSGALLQKAIATNERALELDPNFITARARMAAVRVELGQLAAAYGEAEDLVRRRPDSPDAHFALSYVLRFAGLLQEADRECATATSLDPHNWGWRSCAVVPLARGDYEGAVGYIQLDPGSEWAKALTIHGLVAAGREAEALALGRPDMPQWKSYDLLLACAAKKPEAEIASLAARVTVDADPETNYYSAAHLAYCGQESAALQMLRRAVDAGYCSYPAIDTDPYFATLQNAPGFAEIRSAAIRCQRDFVGQRAES